MIIHIVHIDLDAPGIGFLVTPSTPTLDEASGQTRVLAARTTSGFLDEFDLQVAINGDFFDPWWANWPWDYYPRAGDAVDVRGLAASQGEVYTRGFVSSSAYHTLFITADNVASFDSPAGPIANAISGYLMIVRDGAYNPPPRSAGGFAAETHPRTAVGLDASGRTLILVVVDGRQRNYSEGATLPEMADILIAHGAYEALNLDGGGSVTLAVEGADGEPDVLNSPIHVRIPGHERPIANHLGVYAQPLTSP